MKRTHLITAIILVCALWTLTSCTRASTGKQSPGTELQVGESGDSAGPQKYSDGRPVATLRMEAKDHGIVLL